jgi:hypothetical protein
VSVATAQTALLPRSSPTHAKVVANAGVGRKDEARLPAVNSAAQVERSCRSCRHMQPGSFRWPNGHRREILDCVQGHWVSVTSLVTVYANAKVYRQRAESCPDFSAS